MEERRDNHGLREQMECRQKVLWEAQERRAFLIRCQDVVDFIAPHAANLFARDESRVDGRWRYVLDTEATYCAEVAVAGHINYMAPPGGDWLGLLERDPDLAEDAEVKEWLNKLADRMLRLFEQSNTYDTQRLLTQDALLFGAGAQIVDEDDLYTLWHHHVQAGEYALAANHRKQIDTLYRELTLTVRQCKQRFGEQNLSQDTLKLWKQGPKSWDKPVKIYHAIEPREEGQHAPLDVPQSKLDMPWRSVYWEADSRKDDGVLSESGYRVFPVLAPRYALIGNGLYGYGPGAMCVSHVKSLQHMQHRFGQNVDWQTAPPQLLPENMRGQEGEFRPGGHLFANMADPNHARPLAENRTNLQHLRESIDDFRKQIRRIWNIDAWLMFASIDRANTTAAEIYQRKAEKNAILGPQTARLFNEMLRPLADILFSYMQMRGMLPQPIPHALLTSGAQIDPEFRSVLAEAAKSTKVAQLEQWSSFTAMIGQLDPSVLHVVKTAEIVREHADLSGVPAKMLRSKEEVDQLNQAAAEQQAALQQSAALEQASKTTKNLAQSPTDTPSALTAGAG